MNNHLEDKYIKILKKKIVVSFYRNKVNTKKVFFLGKEKKRKDVLKDAYHYRNNEYLKSDITNTGVRHLSLKIINNKLYLILSINSFYKKCVIKTVKDIDSIIDNMFYTLCNQLGFCKQITIGKKPECTVSLLMYKFQLKYIILDRFGSYLKQYIYKVTTDNNETKIVISNCLTGVWDLMCTSRIKSSIIGICSDRELSNSIIV